MHLLEYQLGSIAMSHARCPRLTLGVIVSAPYLVAGCTANPEAEQPQWSVYDSAGVGVFEVEAAITTLRSPVTPLAMSLERRIRPSETDGATLYRVTAAAVHPNGDVVVANAGSSEILFFDTQPSPDGRFGRRGNGPGEFRSLGSMRIGPNDSIWAYDARLSRMTVIAPTTLEYRTELIRHPEGGVLAQFLGFVSPSGRLFAEGTGISGPRVEGIVEVPFHLWVVDEDGSGRALGSFERAPLYRTVNGDMTGFRTIPFTAAHTFAIHMDTLFVGRGDEPVVWIQSPPGRTATILRWNDDPEAITSSDRSRFVEGRVRGAETEEARRTARETWSRVAEIPTTWPFYDRLLVDDAGSVWIRKVPRPTQDTHNTWFRLNRSDMRVMSLETDKQFQVTTIANGQLLGVWRDSLDVEEIRVYRIDN
jgi:hypothetical protein